jgi:molybdopterin synthase catalytic subunit
MYDGMTEAEFSKMVEYIVPRLKPLVDVVSTESLRLGDLGVSQDAVDIMLMSRAMEAIFPAKNTASAK